jgi:hypothetical protein
MDSRFKALQARVNRLRPEDRTQLFNFMFGYMSRENTFFDGIETGLDTYNFEEKNPNPQVETTQELTDRILRRAGYITT